MTDPYRPKGLSSAVSYQEPKAAYRWLEEAFGFEPLFVMHVGADQPYRRQDLQIPVLRGVAREHLHVVAGCGEPRHDLLADETRPAEDADLQ